MEPVNRVLVADISSEFRYSLRLALEQEQTLRVVGETGNGAQLLELASKLCPDAVVMDLVLAETDGLAVLSQFQHLPRRPRVLVVSSYAQSSVITQAAALGADYYLTKPCSASTVLERVGQLLDGGVEAPVQSPTALETQITGLLHEVGVPANMKGYRYLQRAISMAVQDAQAMIGVTKVLYPEIAKAYHSTSGGVERSIRHAIETAWDRGDLDTLHSYFGYTISSARGKPTNSEFIAMLAERIRMNRYA
jgi:two-component system response regulator (stage 0 sporulation protein A)